ncbi:MAG: hypothetical protein KME10_11660 [Plectolyngbya sp. WJT66-NPBG17]|nr:hypothetical protein [Plectolyngbya sp. WJT66-NPBG17]
MRSEFWTKKGLSWTKSDQSAIALYCLNPQQQTENASMKGRRLFKAGEVALFSSEQCHINVTLLRGSTGLLETVHSN